MAANPSQNASVLGSDAHVSQMGRVCCQRAVTSALSAPAHFVAGMLAYLTVPILIVATTPGFGRAALGDIFLPADRSASKRDSWKTSRLNLAAKNGNIGKRLHPLELKRLIPVVS